MITVLAHNSIRILLNKKVKVYDEPREQISFNMTETAFERFLNKVKGIGLNPYAVMFWEVI
jgi:hypothetical protein